ncbi:MAG: PEP-CTERM system TPR-repeat protein PrsT [Gammaproteobacteria bacterium]|nr:PEP-CTERM system TPR-repeat protein PrsT [Gammaproteobacteria bacterium]
MPHRLKLNCLFKHFILTGFLLVLVGCDNIGMNEQQMLQNAKTYLDRGELMAASIELRNTLQKNNENAEARYLLGNINLKIGDLTSAEKEFKRAALAGWNKEETQIELARIFILRKEFQKLLNEIVIINTWPADTRANISALRAQAEAGLGNTTQAKTTLDEGKAYSAKALYVLKTTAMFQLSGIQDGDASNTLKKALSIYPDNPELLLLYASSDIQNNNLTRAADTFRKIIGLDPSKLITFHGQRAHIGLARLQIIEKNYDEANTTMAPLLKRNGKDPEANYLSGLLAFSQGDYHRAEDHMRTLLAIAPGNSRSQLLMGKIKYALKDFDQAAHHLSAYLNTKPGDIAARKLLTSTYIILNQPEQARLTLQTALTADPDDAETLTLLSQIEFNKGDMNAGIQALNKAIKSRPDNITLHKQLAKAYIATGETDQALKEIKTFQALSRNTEESQRLTISAYLTAGKVNLAIKVANAMLKDKPQDPDIIALNGTLHAANDNKQQARLYFNKALQLQDKLPSATIGLARLERKEGNLDKAIALYNVLVESNVGGIIPMLALSELAAQQNRTNDMLSWLERTRNTAPTETRSRIILANYYLRKTQPEKADIYIQEAIKVAPEQAELLALHGRVLIAQKRYSEALPPLKKLVNKLPDSTNARVLLGEAFLRQGMMKDAREHLQKILNKQNNHILAMSLMAETEFKESNYDKSLSYAKQLQNVQPQLYIGYLHEGNAWMAKQDYNRAHSAFSKAWKHQQTANLAKRLFTVSKHTANFEDAIKPLLTWLNDHPNDKSLRFFLAAQYQDAEQNDNAIREYEKIIEGTPDNGAALNNLAWLYHLKGDPKALDLAERAYRTAPENAGIQDTYGWILTQQNQADKGKRLIKQAMGLIPDNLEIRYHYAAALVKSGNKDEGQQMLEKLLKQNKPFNGRKEAKQLLKTL